MVVDASALVAILLEEPEWEVFARTLLDHPAARLSPVGYWEASTRLHGLRGDAGVVDLDRLIDKLQVSIRPATDQTARLAADAQRAYGKRTRAGLNLGDCFAYALAKEIGAPLLYKGADFGRTDIRPALPA
ncbi:type II toxin-antitoxin system VapC family toxin [uncultured Brevundimonas sp.]|uniref:type II toxin-antitoxin system VapC family toxin n=1 Tax=uncultured Brevundimonas sp. TaxID=213418 RepID=UPI0026141087|nr:type II toxin-antitoxin system VapC family toxin [uncultured Brevundimonas sp.]